MQDLLILIARRVNSRATSVYLHFTVFSLLASRGKLLNWGALRVLRDSSVQMDN